MALPCTPEVQIRLGAGAVFANVLELGSLVNGILGTNALGTSASTLVDISSTTQYVGIRHGRDRMFEQYVPGECTVQWLDFTGAWNPSNTSGPYYGKILPMAQLQVATTYNGTGYPLFSGYIQSWDWEWADQAATYAIVTARAVDGFRVLSLSNVENITGAATNDLPGTRIGQILTQVSWPTQMRDLDTGDTQLQNDPATYRTALDAIQTVENTELGVFFMDERGYATFYDRAALALMAAGTATAFADDGTGIYYQGLDINLDETELANQVTLTNHGGVAQTASDATSIAQYYPRTWAQDGLLMKTNAAALARAGQILAYRKDPRIRIDSITLDLSSVSNRIVPGLTLNIGDPITVKRKMAGGTNLNLRITIQGHSHDIYPDRWITKFTTAYPLSTAFILGSAEFGILGTNTL